MNKEANDTLAEFVKEKISGYCECFNQPHVRLVDFIDGPIISVTETGLRTASQNYEVDIINLAMQ